MIAPRSMRGRANADADVMTPPRRTRRRVPGEWDNWYPFEPETITPGVDSTWPRGRRPQHFGRTDR